MRTVKRIWASQKVNMGGIILDQPLPLRGVDQIDPFLLIHHWDEPVPGGKKQRDVGVGPHPHRGFAPVTFIFKGGVHHRDSRGGNSVVLAGGTQWMNSGMGIIHSERPMKELAENGGEFEIIQFWINAPAANKMDPPSYQPLQENETPKVSLDGGKAEIGVIAGEYDGQRGKIKPYTDLLILRLNLKKGARFKLDIPSDYNALTYQLDGKTQINGKHNSFDKHLAWYNNDGDSIEFEALSDGRMIFLSGRPINEQVTSYGPFVMNTQGEIMQAIRDYQMGKMGVLIEEFED